MPRRPRPPLAAPLVAATAVLAAAARPAHAQAPPAPATPAQAVRTVRVRGVVYDSLLGAPLGGALVTRRGSPGVALTDSAGRFALDGVPGAAGAFVFSHPALDSLGLADLVVPADLSVSSAAPDPVAVALATPSRATTWARLCPGVAPPADLTAVGILAGVVRDAATAAPVAGGVATVVWTAVDTVKRRVVAAPRRFAVPTDEAGAFRVCGVPVGAEFEAQGATDRSATGWAVATMGPRGLASVELLVPPLPCRRYRSRRRAPTPGRPLPRPRRPRRPRRSSSRPRRRGRRRW
jgi:hypothetical protein